MKPLINDATTAFLRAIRVNFVNFGLVIEDIKNRNWASATFVGARHELGLRIVGDGAEAAVERFAASLDAREFELRGHILADIALTEKAPCDGGARIRIEALTVEDF